MPHTLALHPLHTLPGLTLAPRTVFCIGRNYAEHAKELGNAIPTEPVVFLKAQSALTAPTPDSTLALPAESQKMGRIDHEIEAVFAVGRPISSAAEFGREPLSHWIAGVGVGLDFTARDLQERAKQKGLPWTAAKGRRNFAPLGNFTALPDANKISDLTLSLEINGELRQQALLSQMLFPLETLVAHLADTYGLLAGDVIFTGTPPGVGPIVSGDRVRAVLGFGRSVELSTLEIRMDLSG